MHEISITVPMKILILTDEIYPDGVSGVAKSVYNECVALVRLGHEVTVFARSVKKDALVEETIAGFRLKRFFQVERRNRFYHLYPLAILYYTSCFLYKPQQGIDILYIHNPLYILPIIWLRLFNRTPVVYMFHASMAEEIRISAQANKYGKRTWFAKQIAALISVIERWGFSYADIILPRSQYTNLTLRRLYPHLERLVADVIPLGVDTAEYTLGSQDFARDQLNLPHDHPILITVRRLEGRMGLQNLIEAIRSIHQQYPNVLLLIVGKGHLRESLEALVKKYQLESNIRFMGFVSEEDLPQYLAAADLFVLPTEQLEGFGLATIEALAVGLPVMGTPVGATPEILSLIDLSLLTSDATPEAIGRTLIYWLQQPEKIKVLNKRSREVVEEYYNSDLIAAQLATLFNKQIQKHINSLLDT